MLKSTAITVIAVLVAAFVSIFSGPLAAESTQSTAGNAIAETAKARPGTPNKSQAASNRPVTTPEHSTENLEEIQAHVKKHIGEIDTVFHELVSDFIHLDVLFIKATAERPYHVLVTSGVSDEPMKVPEDMADQDRVELLLALPKEWPLTDESFSSENNYWPVRWLKQVGRLPHTYDTWLGWGHTIPNGDPAEPIANTKFVGVMLSPAYALAPEFFQLKTKKGKNIRFYALIPLYQEEMDFKLQNGADALEAKLNKKKVGFLVNPNRPNVVKK